ALALIGLVALAGCDLTSAGVSEQIANIQTIQALTPSPTLSPTVTDTPEATATATATRGPSPTPTNTVPPTATSLPPTPTPNPALAGFSFCDQRAGPTDGLFSARLAEVAASGTPAYEQVVMRFELGEGSAPLGATASCLGAADVAALAPDSAAPFAVRVSLPGWLRDERYTSSPVTQTLSFTGTRTITSARLIPADTPDAGATLLLGLSQPLPFRLTVERNPTRLVIAVARSSPIVASSDQLRVAAGGGKPDLTAPLFTLFDGDIWRIEAGAKGGSPGITPGIAGATNLTSSPESETHLAVSPDGTSVAFCRAAPGLDPADAQLSVPSTLWLMDADGKNPRAIAQVGVSCADPAFSPDGATLAFAVDETGATPIQRAIYIISATRGQPRRITEGVDEWSRFGPQWLKGGDMVFAAASQDGRSTLFLRRASGEVVDVGATVLVRDNGAPPYAALGRPMAAPDGSRFAVEALRSDAPGADLAILNADGKLLEVIGAQRLVPPTPTPSPSATRPPTRTPRPTSTQATPVGTITATIARTATATPSASAVLATTTTPTTTATIAPTLEPAPPAEEVRQGPFWTRPVAWDAQGHLIYLTTLCASQAVQDYQLYRWDGAQRSELIAAGQTFGGIGQATIIGGGLAYVLSEQGPVGPRGPAAPAPRSPAAIWLWDLAAGIRGELLSAERGFAALEP
ncbi:MAG: hypothetical protein HGA45_32380, partial [Chloroflexales bacterium]|nr:hypothetical protein [Chloroflexales bacterium]